MNAINKQMDLFGKLPKQKKIKASGGALAVGGERGEIMSIGELTDAYNMYRGNADSAKLTPDEMDAILDIFLEDMPSAGKSYAEGGLEDGGLKEEGGEVDPVSGNDVPPGSTKEEVRDDIPAQLSEGEFVFPADVVRYIGLEKLMMLRQEAKQGLKMMEAMGQMGNSEEATVPDDLPFAITDLIIVDSDEKEEYNNDDDETKEMNVGGFLPPNQQTQSNTGVYYQPSNLPTTTGILQPPVAASSSYQAPTQYAAPVQQFTPTIQTQAAPKAKEFLKGDEEAARLITVVNPDTGEEKQINFIPGVTQIPEGFVLKSEYEPEEKVTTQSATTQTTRIASQNDDDDEPSTPPSGASISFGGNLTKKGTVENAFTGDLSFSGLNPLTGGVAQMVGFAANRFMGKPLPENMKATITNIKAPRPEGVYTEKPTVYTAKFEMSGKTYNDLFMDKDGRTNVTSRTEMEDLMKDVVNRYGEDYLSKTTATLDLDQLLEDKRERDRKEAAYQREKQRLDREARTASRIKEEEARQAELNRIAAERERAILGDRDDDGGGTTALGTDFGNQTGLGSGATPGGYGGTGVGRSDVGMAKGGLAKQMKQSGLASKK